MSKIAQTPTMYLDTSGEYRGMEWFESRGRKGSNRRAVICGAYLRQYFNLPEKVTELWLIAHNAPTTGGLHVSLQIGFDKWVYCQVVDKIVPNQDKHIFDERMDRYLTKRLRLTGDNVKDIFVTCEYR